MKTDALFYELFQEFPEFFFELIGQTSEEAQYYRFTATEIKQTAFRLDGLFMPMRPDKPLYILEVQFQNDPQFYGRLFAEMFLYFYRQSWKGAWRTVVLFPRRSFEPEEIEPYRMLLDSPLVQRVYLEELEQSSTVGVGIIRLVVAKEKEAPEQARQLIVQARSQYPEALTQRGVLELIEMVMVYKFSKLSRQEIEAMLKLFRHWQLVVLAGRKSSTY